MKRWIGLALLPLLVPVGLAAATPLAPQGPAAVDTARAAAPPDTQGRVPAGRDSGAAAASVAVDPEGTTMRRYVPWVMGLFAVAMVVMGWGFVAAIQGDEEVAVETRWGGFGGGGGGWRMSRPLSYLTALLFFGGMIAMLVLSGPVEVKNGSSPQGGRQENAPTTTVPTNPAGDK